MTSGKGDLTDMTENIMKGFVDNFENVAVNKKDIRIDNFVSGNLNLINADVC